MDSGHTTGNTSVVPPQLEIIEDSIKHIIESGGANSTSLLSTAISRLESPAIASLSLQLAAVALDRFAMKNQDDDRSQSADPEQAGHTAPSDDSEEEVVFVKHVQRRFRPLVRRLHDNASRLSRAIVTGPVSPPHPASKPSPAASIPTAEELTVPSTADKEIAETSQDHPKSPAAANTTAPDQRSPRAGPQATADQAVSQETRASQTHELSSDAAPTQSSSLQPSNESRSPTPNPSRFTLAFPGWGADFLGRPKPSCNPTDTATPQGSTEDVAMDTSGQHGTLQSPSTDSSTTLPANTRASGDQAASTRLGPGAETGKRKGSSDEGSPRPTEETPANKAVSTDEPDTVEHTSPTPSTPRTRAVVYRPPAKKRTPRPTKATSTHTNDEDASNSGQEKEDEDMDIDAEGETELSDVHSGADNPDDRMEDDLADPGVSDGHDPTLDQELLKTINPSPQSRSIPTPSKTLSKDWVLACQIILDICSVGPTDPSRIADQAFLMLLPLEVIEEYRLPGARAGEHSVPSLDAWLEAISNVERSHSLTMTRTLQLIIDTCLFMQEHRTRWLQTRSADGSAESFQELVASHNIPAFSIFADSHDNAADSHFKGLSINSLSVIGARVQGLASILGSSSFIVFLMLTSQLSTLTRIRQTKGSTLAALSHLLRGGRPMVDGLPKDEVEFVQAAVFGAHVVLPRVLNHFLAAASKAFDDRRPDDPVTALYVENETSNVLSQVSTEFTAIPHPQPLVARTDPTGEFLAPLNFGLMSGYGENRRPVTILPRWLLTKNYSRFGANSHAIRQTKTLQHIFTGKVHQADPSYPAPGNQITAELEIEYDQAVRLRHAYLSYFGISPEDRGINDIMTSVQEGSNLAGPTPCAPTHQYLRSRQAEFARSRTPSTLPAVPFATIGPAGSEQEAISDDEMDSD
ncbi:hypothetical protein A4X13_0g6052 [Tilletia indica]|uniref:Uncharacterized protein n=1 Tax=Tilletia indica TaxID=43049 RepID=A0A177T784_9BASI|nr:hypothetical protein A4X13_0g6052 [Tilletia indica]